MLFKKRIGKAVEGIQRGKLIMRNEKNGSNSEPFFRLRTNFQTRRSKPLTLLFIGRQPVITRAHSKEAFLILALADRRNIDVSDLPTGH